MIEADGSTVSSMHVYEVRPRRDDRGVDLISVACAPVSGKPTSNVVANTGNENGALRLADFIVSVFHL
jgi:hypothetical protein